MQLLIHLNLLLGQLTFSYTVLDIGDLEPLYKQKICCHHTRVVILATPSYVQACTRN